VNKNTGKIINYFPIKQVDPIGNYDSIPLRLLHITLRLLHIVIISK